MLRLNCFIKVDEKNRQEVLDAARRLTAATLQQTGCIAYDIFESATRPEVMMICETWADDYALKAHSESEVFIKEVTTMRSLSEMKLETFRF
ncbi:MAG: antibiotic biosynthesis monooxygenase [Muribaculaceae bacterium]|nr:antibiotic biosynthesis monooxygenase [Muribaculaceae bacterium]